MKKVLSGIIFAIIVGAAAVYFFRHQEEFYLISSVSVAAIFILSVLTVIGSLAYAIRLKIVTDHYGLNLTLMDCFGISRAVTFIDMWLPFAGASSLKAVYLKKFHNLQYSSFIASMGIAQITRILVNSALAIILLVIASVRINVWLTTAVASIFICTLLFFLLAHRISKRFFRISWYLGTLMEEWGKIRRDHKTIKRLLALSLANFALGVFVVDESFRAFEISIPLAASGLISAFTAISGVINLVPGNLGIQEAVVVVASGMFGRSVNEGLHAAALMRIVRTIWTFALAPAFSPKLLKKTD